MSHADLWLTHCDSFSLDQITDVAEQPAMLELHTTYGKTIHTWPIDTSPEFPFGPPNLMMSYTGPGQASEEVVQDRDKAMSISTEEKRKVREGYLPPYEKVAGADAWEKSGKAIVFEPVEKEVKFT